MICACAWLSTCPTRPPSGSSAMVNGPPSPGYMPTIGGHDEQRHVRQRRPARPAARTARASSARSPSRVRRRTALVEDRDEQGRALPSAGWPAGSPRASARSSASAGVGDRGTTSVASAYAFVCRRPGTHASWNDRSEGSASRSISAQGRNQAGVRRLNASGHSSSTFRPSSSATRARCRVWGIRPGARPLRGRLRIDANLSSESVRRMAPLGHGGLYRLIHPQALQNVPDVGR